MPSEATSNASSSLVIADGRPSTRAMPSPVSETRPTSSRACLGREARDIALDGLRISSGRIVSSVIGYASFDW